MCKKMPDDVALRLLLFFAKTSVPRIIAEQRLKEKGGIDHDKAKQA